MKIQIKLTMLTLLITLSSFCRAQIKPTSYKIGFMNEMISMPTYKVYQSPIHPGFTLGTDLWEKKETRWPQTLGANFGYYYHELYEHAFMLDAAYSFGYEFKFGLRFKILIDLGYKHSVLSGDVYKFEDGEYHESTHWGKAQFNAKAGLGLEYPVYNAYSITIEWREMLALPYSPDQGMPFALHTLFGVGVKYTL